MMCHLLLSPGSCYYRMYPTCIWHRRHLRYDHHHPHLRDDHHEGLHPIRRRVLPRWAPSRDVAPATCSSSTSPRTRSTWLLGKERCAPFVACVWVQYEGLFQLYYCLVCFVFYALRTASCCGPCSLFALCFDGDKLQVAELVVVAINASAHARLKCVSWLFWV